MKKYILAIVLLLSPFPLSASSIYEVFSGEIFDVPWESSLETVKQIHPGGTMARGTDNVYQVKDGRPVMGIDRPRNSKISFGFDDIGRMVSVSVDFPNDAMGELHLRMDTLFGPAELHAFSEIPGTTWPEDRGYSVSLHLVPEGVFLQKVQLTMIISYRPEIRPDATKEGLGF